MEGIEFTTNNNEFITNNGRLLRFLVDCDMGDMHPMDNTVGGMMDEELEISTEEGEVRIEERVKTSHCNEVSILYLQTVGKILQFPN